MDTNQIYEAALSDELQKIAACGQMHVSKRLKKRAAMTKYAAPIGVGGVLRRLWSPFGQTRVLRRGARVQLLQQARAARGMKAGAQEALAGAKAHKASQMLAQQQRVAEITGRIQRAGQPGVIERAVGGRFGTQARRMRGLGAAKQELSQANLAHIESNLESAARIRKLRGQVGPATRTGRAMMREAREQYGSTVGSLGLRRTANIGARIGMGGLGVAGAASAYQGIQNRRYAPRSYYS